MSSQLVSLAWDGHHKTLVSVFEKLLVNNHLVDCTIAAEGQKLKAHTEILSAFSPFFKLLFKEESENNPIVIISGITFRDLKSLVDFIYQGKLEVTEDRIQDLIDAAECLQIEGLGGGHKEDDSGNINNIEVLPKRPALSCGIPRKQRRKRESEVVGSVHSKQSEVNNGKHSKEVQPENCVVTTGGARQSSQVRDLMPNADVQNVAIVSDISVMPTQSSVCEIEMDGLRLEGERVVRKETDSVGGEYINQQMIDRRRGLRVCGNNGNSYENSGEEAILGLSSDISVLSEKSENQDLPLDCVPATSLSSELCSRNLTGSFARNELSNINVNSTSESVNRVVSAVETHAPLLQSEFHMATVNETLLTVDYDLINENDVFSNNMPVRKGVSSVTDVHMKAVRTTKKSDSSGAALRCSEESAHSPQELAPAFFKIQGIGRNEPVLGLMPGLSLEANPHHSPTNPSQAHIFDRDLQGPSGRDLSSESSSTDQQYRCQICGKTFARKRHLNDHMRIHTDNRLSRNDECNNAAVTSIKVKKQRTASGRNLHTCTLCEFKSVHPKQLKTHMKIHREKKHFKCSECEYRSANRSHLESHQRTHSGVKPYKCKECEFTCADKSNLKKHQLIHGGIYYKCSECNYTTVRGDALKIHVRSHSRKTLKV